MLICPFLAGNLSKFGLTFVILAPFRRRFTFLQRITDSLIRDRSTSGVLITTTVYCIWLSRNKLIFEDYQFSVIEVISKIKFLMYTQAHLLHLF